MIDPIRTAVIPAAGIGTRTLPATKAVPKELAVILGKPALQWIVEEAVAAGVERVVVVVGPGKEAIREHFRPKPDLNHVLHEKGKKEILGEIEALDALAEKVEFVTQQQPLGLGHAVLCAAQAVGRERFLVLLGDALVRSPHAPCATQLANVSTETGGHSVIGLERVPQGRVSRYGIVAGHRVRERLYELSGLVEKPDIDAAPSNLAIAGRYVLTPIVFELLKTLPPGKNGEIQLTDALHALLALETLYGYRYEGERHDIGNAVGYFDTALAFALDHPAYRACVERRLAATRM